MKHLRIAISALVTVLTIVSLAACSAFDVVARYSVPAFEAVTELIDVESNPVDGSFELIAPDGARLVISTDFNRSESDITMIFEAAPLLAAGLDATRLPAGYSLDPDGKLLAISFDIGSTKLAGFPGRSVVDTFRGIVTSYRKNIGYHDVLDHYGIALGNGNMFEWARDVAMNDKDMVFVLNPEPFITAGVDPNKAEGFVFAKVPIKDENDVLKEVDKLLRPYNLK